LAENKNLPAIVKIDGFLTVRQTTSELTSAKKFDDDRDEKMEADEVIKQQTLAAQQFAGPDPVLEACKAWPALASIGDRDFVLEKLEQDRDLRVQVTSRHPIVRYVMEGIGFEFPADEHLPKTDPEMTQVWNQHEIEFDQQE